MISGAIDAGLKGLNKSLQSIEQTANDVARAGSFNAKSSDEVNTDNKLALVTDDNLAPDLASSLVELNLYEQSFAASARVVSVTDDLLGTLLDTTA